MTKLSLKLEWTQVSNCNINNFSASTKYSITMPSYVNSKWKLQIEWMWPSGCAVLIETCDSEYLQLPSSSGDDKTSTSTLFEFVLNARNANAMNIDWNFQVWRFGVAAQTPFTLAWNVVALFGNETYMIKTCSVASSNAEYFMACKICDSNWKSQKKEEAHTHTHSHCDRVIIVCVLRECLFFGSCLVFRMGFIESRLCCFHRYDGTKCDQNNRNMAPMRWIRYQNQHHLFKLDRDGKTNAQYHTAHTSPASSFHQKVEFEQRHTERESE